MLVESDTEKMVRDLLKVRPTVPPHTQKVGASIVSWWEGKPGDAVIIAREGSPEDRTLAEKLVAIELEGVGYKRAHFTFEDAGMTREAGWSDIMAKAKRLIQSGAVTILRNGYNNIVGHVEGDHGDYNTEIGRDDPSSQSITTWDCSCPWSQFAWGRSRQWKKYEGRPCTRNYSLVTMADGTYKRMDEVEAGEYVMTHDGPGKITEVMVRPYKGDMFQITSFGFHTPLELTPQHRVWGYGTPQRFRKEYNLAKDGQGFKIWDEDFLFDHDPSWIEAKDLLVHDWLTGSIRHHSFNGPIDFLSLLTEEEQSEFVMEGDVVRRVYQKKNPKSGKLNEIKYMGEFPSKIYPSADLMTVIGLFIAEGSFVRRGKTNLPAELHYSFHKKETDLAQAIQESCHRLGLGDASIYPHPVANKMSVRLTNHPFALFMYKMVHEYSTSKRLHPWLMNLSPSFQQTLLHYHWLGDGHKVDTEIADNRSFISTASDQLCRQVFDMLLRTGKMPSWNLEENSPGPNQRKLKKSFKKYYLNKIAWVEEPEFYNGRRKNADKYYSAKISKIKSELYEGEVYNLSVEPQESYEVEGRIVHNCAHVMALYWQSKQTPLDDYDPEKHGPMPGQKMGEPPAPGGGTPPSPGSPGGPPPGPPGGPVPGPSTPSPIETPSPAGLAPPGESGVLPKPPMDQLAEQAPPIPGQTPAGMPANPSITSVPGAKTQTPFNPIQFPGGTYSTHIGSAPEEPPNYRKGTDTEHCGNCKMFNNGRCWGYGNKSVKADDICDSWYRESSKKEAANQEFEAPEIVRLKTEGYGMAEGKSEAHGAGQYQSVPAGSTGEVLSQDPTTGWVEIIIPLKGGNLTPYHIKLFVDPSDIEHTGQQPPGPFVRRRS